VTTRELRDPIKMVNVRLAAIAALAMQLLVSPASGQDSLFVPLFTYRTGPFANSGGPIANGMRDYLTLLNERDGGIGGIRLLIEECETGYDNAKGVACYEAVKSRQPVMINPWSTGITLELIPRATADQIPILSMAYGLSASARGNTFPWIFNPPATYWDGLSMIIRHIASESGGLRKLAGQKLGFLYLDSGFGKEPIPLFQSLSRDLGFELKLYPVQPAQMQQQAELWKQIVSDRRDYVVMYGWGAMNPTSIKEAVANGFPMAKLLSIWWFGDADLQHFGAAATGLKTLNWHNVGQGFPLMQDILKLVVDRNKSRFSAHGHAHITFFEVFINPVSERFDVGPLSIRIRFGHAWVLMNAPHGIVKFEAHFTGIC